MDEVERGGAPELRLVPAEQPGPGRVGALETALCIDHGEEVRAHLPGDAAVERARQHLPLQIGVEQPQPVLHLLPGGVRGAALGGVEEGADRAAQLAVLPDGNRPIFDGQRLGGADGQERLVRDVRGRSVPRATVDRTIGDGIGRAVRTMRVDHVVELATYRLGLAAEVHHPHECGIAQRGDAVAVDRVEALHHGIEQQAQPALAAQQPLGGAALLRAVAQHLDEADRLARVVAQHRQPPGRPEALAVLATVPALVVADAARARGRHLDSGAAGGDVLGREDPVHALPAHLRFRPAQGAAGAGAPRRHPPLAVGGDDREIGRAVYNPAAERHFGARSQLH